MSADRVVEVYRAKNGFQAHAYVQALAEVRIQATLDGEHPAGWNVGAVDWSQAPRILVREQDASQARELLLGLEAIERRNS